MNKATLRLIALTIGVTAAFGISRAGSAGREISPPMETVPHVDIERYLGKWYEVAKFPHFFQKGCDCATATYSLMEDGKIRVLNSCVTQDKNRSVRSVTGKAWIVDPETRSKLKVSFFGPVSGNYWIIDLGQEYEYSVVSEPTRNHLWILSRTPEMAEETYLGILSRLQEKGFDLSRLTRSRQAPDPACIPGQP